jgi:hypothetical protein
VAYDGPDAERSLLVIWGAGCLELHAELVQYARWWQHWLIPV